MKKTLRLALCLILVCAMLAPSLCFAEENYDTLADWDLKVKVPEGTTAVLKGSTYYIPPCSRAAPITSTPSTPAISPM